MHAGLVHAELPGADDATASGLAVPGGVACMVPDTLLLGVGVALGAGNVIGGFGLCELQKKHTVKR